MGLVRAKAATVKHEGALLGVLPLGYILPHYGSQREIADDLGVNQATVCRWMNGEMIPSLYHMMVIRLYTGVPMEVLVGTRHPRGTEAHRLQLRDQWGQWADKRHHRGQQYVLAPRALMGAIR